MPRLLRLPLPLLRLRRLPLRLPLLLRPAPAPPLRLSLRPVPCSCPGSCARYPRALPQEPVCEALTKTLVEAYAEKQVGIHGHLCKFLFVKYLRRPSWILMPRSRPASMGISASAWL